MINRLFCCSSTSVHPYRNLALEERLFNAVEPDSCILYLWQNQRTVVIGRNQNARAQCKVEDLTRDGGFLARRLSGGGAVFHDLGNLNFTFLVRDDNYDLRRQLSVICEAVSGFGIQAEISGRNDVLTEGRKFSGNAYYRHGDRRYHHGTLLVDADKADMARYLTPDKAKLQAKGVDSVRSRVVNLRELCPDITVDGLRSAMIAALEQVYGLPVSTLPQPEDSKLAEGRARFASFDWLYGQERGYTLETETIRFPWGCAQLCLTVEGGRIVDGLLYTDAMEAELADVVRRALMGCPFAPGAARTALRAAAEEHPDLSLPLRDIGGML